MCLRQPVTNHWQWSRMNVRVQETYGISWYLGEWKDYSGAPKTQGSWTRRVLVPLLSFACLLLGKERAGRQWSTATTFNYSLPSGKLPNQNISMEISTFWLKSQVCGVEFARKNELWLHSNREQSQAVSTGHKPGLFTQGAFTCLWVFASGHKERGPMPGCPPLPICKLSKPGLEGK